MNRRVLGLLAVAGLVGVTVGCGGGSDTVAAAGSGPGMQHPLQARRYDPTRECYWETEPIEGLYGVQQLEFPNASVGPVCVISDTGDAYVAMVGTSVAVVKTDSTAGWLVPTWSFNYPGYYDYSTLTSDEQALCDEAKTRLFLANYPDSEPITTCTAGAGGAGGSSGSISTAGAGGTKSGGSGGIPTGGSEVSAGTAGVRAVGGSGNAAGTGGAGGAGGFGNSVGKGGSGGAAGSAGIVGDGGTAGDGCIREYDLASYTGSTEGLCPAAEVNHCDCWDRGAAVITVCAPDASVCITQGEICEPNQTDCGWVDCDSPPFDDPEFCDSIIDKVENPAPLWQCVRDADCREPELCVLRIHNRMFCADPNAGGAGGAAGAGGNAVQEGAGDRP
jgi:hypothetical protein